MTIALAFAGVGGNGVCLRYFGTAEWGCVGAKKVQPFAAGLSAGHSSKGPGRSGKERQDFYLGLVQMAAYLKARPSACSVIWRQRMGVWGCIAGRSPAAICHSMGPHAQAVCCWLMCCFLGHVLREEVRGCCTCWRCVFTHR